jgi:hypothetical protein
MGWDGFLMRFGEKNGFAARSGLPNSAFPTILKHAQIIG